MQSTSTPWSPRGAPTMLTATGPEMAGLALAGDLNELLAGTAPVEIEHRLESVKLIPRDGVPGAGPRHHGYLTVEAVARPEVTAPLRRRVFGMAVTARDDRDRGRPSAWSAAIDSLAVDFDGDGDNPRLLVVSAGNVSDSNAWPDYPDSNDTDGVHDPAQAWNALTVGACTDLVRITEPDAGGYAPIAPEGGLSPFSTTSLTWEPHWPLKPDVVLEGGNAAEDPISAVWLPSPEFADHSSPPGESALHDHQRHQRGDRTRVAIRRAGHGDLSRTLAGNHPRPDCAFRGMDRHNETSVLAGHPSRQQEGLPALGPAMWIRCSGHRPGTVVRREFPDDGGRGASASFQTRRSNPPTLRDMHLHDLPWPRDVLEDLGETPVEMRITLSYFIEPNPSRRGHRSRYRYESHGLRFDVKRPLESVVEFRKRVNLAARDEDEGNPRRGDGDSAWLIGARGRHRGSLHGDIWQGTAADLASRGVIAVYPTAGWWKTRQALERYDKAARYALVVSIRAPEVDVDLYTEVANRIAVGVDVGL